MVEEREKAVRLVILGQGCFVLTMFGCVAIEPSWLAFKRGLSYYGNEPSTVGPYLLGFVVCILLTAMGLRRLRSRIRPTQRFRAAAGLVLALMVPIPLTPYSVDPVLDWLHLGAVTVLFSAGLIVGCWLAFRVLGDRSSCGLFAIQVLAGLSIVAAQAGLSDYMIPSELAFQVAFAALIVRAIRGIAVFHPA